MRGDRLLAVRGTPRVSTGAHWSPCLVRVEMRGLFCGEGSAPLAALALWATANAFVRWPCSGRAELKGCIAMYFPRDLLFEVNF